LLSLESSDCGLGAVGSSSDEFGTHSLSDGRLSPSNLWMSGRLTPRYGFLVQTSCSSSCQWSVYRVTALAFCPVAAGGLNKRTSYPHLFLGSSADTNVILSLVACANHGLLRVTCMSSNQTRVLLVSLELAMVERSRVYCHRRCSEPLDCSNCYAIVEYDRAEIDGAKPPWLSH
jgi:hypothetical protein